ncbi:MAG: nucleotidyltransferase domain-containing protein [Vampirovibrionales bacterium]|nr:nucleotidyltransferase domain-containing protein [Vampirovibrionales bacterium]
MTASDASVEKGFHGLSDAQVALMRQILAPYVNRIARVDIFGSRATGTYRASSDIDLSLRGHVDEALLARLTTLFIESRLPFKVDLHAYDAIAYAPLKDIVDRQGRPFLTRDDLLCEEKTGS